MVLFDAIFAAGKSIWLHWLSRKIRKPIDSLSCDIRLQSRLLEGSFTLQRETDARNTPTGPLSFGNISSPDQLWSSIVIVITVTAIDDPT